MSETNDYKSDRILLSKGQLIHVSGLPFELESDTIVLGCKNNLEYLEANEQNPYKLLGVTDTPIAAQSVTSDTIKPSSESMNCLR